MRHYSNMLRVTARGYIDYDPGSKNRKPRYTRKESDPYDMLNEDQLKNVKLGFKVVKGMLSDCKKMLKMSDYDPDYGMYREHDKFLNAADQFSIDATDLFEVSSNILFDGGSANSMADEFERMANIINSKSGEVYWLARKLSDIYKDYYEGDHDFSEYVQDRNEYELAHMKVREIGGMLEYVYDLLVRMQQQAKGY